jgi:predicted TIM-barrel enzyme
MSKFSDTVSTARISAAKKIGAKVRSSNLGTTTNGAVNYKSTLKKRDMKLLDF